MDAGRSICVDYDVQVEVSNRPRASLVSPELLPEVRRQQLLSRPASQWRDLLHSDPLPNLHGSKSRSQVQRRSIRMKTSSSITTSTSPPDSQPLRPPHVTEGPGKLLILKEGQYHAVCVSGCSDWCNSCSNKFVTKYVTRSAVVASAAEMALAVAVGVTLHPINTTTSRRGEEEDHGATVLTRIRVKKKLCVIYTCVAYL